VIFEMSGGIVFTYRGSWCAEGCHTSWNGDWRIIGTEGTLLMEQDSLPSGERLKENGERKFILDKDKIEGELPEMNGAGIAGSLNEFLDALDSGTTPQCECRDNIKSLAMVFAAIESSRRGEKVNLKDVLA